MSNPTAETKTTRVGMFDTVVEADQALRSLRAAGFSDKELGVLCSLKSLKSFFPDVAEPHLAKVHTSQTITAGAAGASIGGLALAVLAATTGVVALPAAAAILVGGGALAGVFAGAIYGLKLPKGIITTAL